MVKKTNREVNNTLDDIMRWDLNGTLLRSTDRAVYWTVDRVVNGIASIAVHDTVRDTVLRVKQSDPVQEFLHSCGAEMETQ